MTSSKLLALPLAAAGLFAAASLQAQTTMPSSASPPNTITTPVSDPSGPKTREQVKAELREAQANGTLHDFNGDITVARELQTNSGNGR